MAVNRQKGLLQVATNLPTQVAPAAGRTAVPASGSSQALTAAANASGSIAKSLDLLGSDIGKLADHAARVEGAREGAQAGLDPEFRPTRSLTIRGEAYDAAGLKVAGSRIRLEVEADIDAGGDLDAKRASWLKNTQELPELRPDIEHMFQRGKLVAARKAAREHEARIREEAIGTLQTEVDASIKGLHQRAYALGLDAKADEALKADIAMLEKRLAETGPDGNRLIAPARAAALIGQAREAVTDARLLGAFERLPSTAARAAFIEKVEADFKASKGLAKHYDLAGFQRITGQLQAGLRQQMAHERQAASGLREEIKRIGKHIEKGGAPTPDELAALRARAASTPELAPDLAKLEDLSQFQAKLRLSKPGQIDAYIDLEQREMTTGATPSSGHRQDRLQLAKKFVTEMRKGLKDDMLGWAGRVGYSKIGELDFSDDQKLLASFKARIVQAEDVAKFYGQPVQYLRPHERARLAELASKGGGNLMGIAAVLTENAGDPKKALKIMGEIHKEAPTVAVIGGLVARAGAVPAARDAADGVALPKDFKSHLPSAAKTIAFARQVHGGTLSRLPQTEQALIDATNMAYKVRAARRTLTEFNDTLWKQTFREMLGERADADGETYGGIVYTRPGVLWGGSGAIILPPDVKQSAFPELLKSITIEDFGSNPPRYGNGKPVSIADFRKATLVQAGNGRYHLNLGDENDPQFLKGAGEEPFVLDLENMEGTLRERLPEAYLGGGPKVVNKVKAVTQDAPSAAETRSLAPADGPDYSKLSFDDEVNQRIKASGEELSDGVIEHYIRETAKRRGINLTEDEIGGLAYGSLDIEDVLKRKGAQGAKPPPASGPDYSKLSFDDEVTQRIQASGEEPTDGVIEHHIRETAKRRGLDLTEDEIGGLAYGALTIEEVMQRRQGEGRK